MFSLSEVWGQKAAAVDDEAEYFRDVAEMLRGLAAEQRYDLRRRDQLLALADGFERFARRLEREAEIAD